MPTHFADSALAKALCESLRERFPGRAPDLEPLALTLSEKLAEARAAWPALALEEEGFLAHLVARLPEDLEPLAALRSARAGELALCWACARGDAAALAAFDASYTATLSRAAAKARSVDAADVLQLLRERLFVGESPRILGYAGQGSLAGWLQVTATRLVLDLERKKTERPLAQEPSEPRAVPAPEDPEAEYLRRLYGQEFRAAFEAATAALTPDERNTLRYYYLQGLGIDQLAAARGVHRATAARQVQRAREALSAALRERLSQKLRVGGAELESVLRVLGSDLHVSVRRVLEQELEGER